MLERLRELIGALGARAIQWTIACASCKVNLHRFLGRPETLFADDPDGFLGKHHLPLVEDGQVGIGFFHGTISRGFEDFLPTRGLHGASKAGGP